jgi:hypothetical protein
MSFLDRAKERAEELAKKAKPMAENAVEKAKPMAEKAKEKAGQMAERAKESASGFRDGLHGDDDKVANDDNGTKPTDGTGTAPPGPAPS